MLECLVLSTSVNLKGLYKDKKTKRIVSTVMHLVLRNAKLEQKKY